MSLMSPSSYYHGLYREHFAAFWRSLDDHGSVSRVRGRLNPTRFSMQSDQHFSVVDLVARPRHGLQDHLQEIPAIDQPNFLCGLFYSVLVDQVMYSHRPADYPTFRALTQYPKMDRTVGYARTLMMADPYEIFADEILSSRGILLEQVGDTFAAWATFIADDLRSFFAQHQIGTCTWPTVREAMLHDSSCTWGQLGGVLARALRSDFEDSF